MSDWPGRIIATFAIIATLLAIVVFYFDLLTTFTGTVIR